MITFSYSYGALEELIRLPRIEVFVMMMDAWSRQARRPGLP